MVTRAKELGDAAEELVATWLQEQGLSIVARNLRLGMLEIDIVARDNKVIVVVEVRSRAPRSWTSGFSSLNLTKRKRIRMAGERLWNRRYKNDPSVDRLRFDAASVTFTDENPRLEYVRGAF